MLHVAAEPAQNPANRRKSDALNLLHVEGYGCMKNAMAEPSNCWGHTEREARRNKILKLALKPKEAPDENCRALIKKGPVSVLKK